MSAVSSTSASSALAGSATPSINVTGLASGLDTTSIITGLLSVDQAKVTQLQNQQSAITSEQTAYAQLQADLLALQSDAQALSSSRNNVFQSLNVVSSDPSVVTAAASNSATPGVYALTVNSLAQADEIASQGMSGPSSTITQGTIQLQVGEKTAATITIDSTNDTLQGLANAINAAGAGVRAAIVNDGSGGALSYRLLLTAQSSGTSNAIQITNSLAGDSGGAVKPVFDATYIGAAQTGSGYTGTAVPTSNAGAGGYTGDSNNTYTFTVVSGGTVGADNGIQIAYADDTGANSGTITLNSGDAGVLKSVAQGLQIAFGAGTLVAGQTVSVNAYVPTVQQAANASVTLGSGRGALTLQSPNNTMNGVIPGVTLNLQSADPSTPVSLTVSNNTAAATTAISNFVSDYNSLMSLISQDTAYDPTTKTGGPLLGDNSVNTIKNRISSIVGTVVAGTNPLLNNLASLGIATNSSGQLTINQSKLSAALAGNVSGVSYADVARLFTLSGFSNNPGIEFVTGSSKTLASATPYQVQVTSAAQQASINATNPLSSITNITSSNNSFTINVDGQTSAAITLNAGSYSPAALASALQTAINNESSLNGRQVSVGLTASNQLAITSGTFGSVSHVAIGTGSAVTALGFSGTEAGQGQDVAGNFIVNGIVEPAAGTGQILFGNSGNANTSGLEVSVTLNQAQIGSGLTADLTVSSGITAQLGNVLNSLLDPVSGQLVSINNGFQTSLTNLQSAITAQNNFIAQKRQTLLTEFTNMETAVSQLQAISGLLTQQANATSIFGNSSSSSRTSGS
jgi:flagellar hook-associated protein 2